MTNEKKIKILSNQLDRLHPTKDFLDMFYISHWQTETLEYFRVFFGTDSELYKKCKQYNEEANEEHKAKTYTVGSAMWLVQYTDMLFSAIGVLQHNLHKKSKFAVTLRGFTLAGVLTIIVGFSTLMFYVGKSEGVSLGKSFIIPASNNEPKNTTSDKTQNQTDNRRTQTPIHIDSIKN